jgi:hypothetical protein
LLRQALRANGLEEDRLGRVPLAGGRQEKRNRVAFFVSRALAIRPLPRNFHLGLIHGNYSRA